MGFDQKGISIFRVDIGDAGQWNMTEEGFAKPLASFAASKDALEYAGDKLLQQVAERLAVCVRSGDTACRYGGDEFVVMLPEIDGQESAAFFSRQCRTSLGR